MLPSGKKFTTAKIIYTKFINHTMQTDKGTTYIKDIFGMNFACLKGREDKECNQSKKQIFKNK